MFKIKYLLWGNPGKIKQLRQEYSSDVVVLYEKLMTSGGAYRYNCSNCGVVLRDDVGLEEFIKNDELCILKLYNSNFQKRGAYWENVEDFLMSGTLLSKIFLMINSVFRSGMMRLII